MVNPQVGFQPRTTPAERRAFYDLQRQLGNTTDIVVNAGGVTAIAALTQAEYDALTPPDPTTLYLILPP